MKTIVKSPSEEVVEGWDWSDRLGSATLSASTWTVGSGLTGVNATYDDTSTSVELTGGTATTQYLVTNLVTASDGQKYERSFKVMVRTR